jgi:hypothetical protein
LFSTGEKIISVSKENANMRLVITFDEMLRTDEPQESA